MGLIDELNDGAAESFYGDGHEDAEEAGGVNEQSEEEHEGKLAFLSDDVLSKPFINQIARMGSLTAYVQGNWDALQAYLAAGMNDNDITYDITEVTMSEALVLSLGLNLVGFFIPEMSDVADSFSTRVLAEAEKSALDEETRERVHAIQREVEEQRFAKALGYESVEDFRKDLGDPEKLFTVQSDEPPPGAFISVPRDDSSPEE